MAFPLVSNAGQYWFGLVKEALVPLVMVEENRGSGGQMKNVLPQYPGPIE
jgi:hypothetical protein